MIIDPSRMAKLLRPALSVLVLIALSGCLLISGEETTIDLRNGVGNLSASFVSAEGGEERTVQLGLPDAEVQVIVIVAVESGDLQIEVLQPDGALAFAVAARPDTQVTQSSLVRSNAQGEVRYRVAARGARNGSFQVFFQP